MSSRRLLAAALVCALPFASVAAETAEAPAAETVKWVMPWKAGMVHKYAMEDVETETKAGVRAQHRTRSNVIVRVTQADDGFVQAWSDEPGSARFDILEGDKTSEAAMRTAMEALADVVVEVGLDKDGNYAGMRNLDDVLPRLRTAMLPVAQAGVDAMIEKAEKDPAKREEARKAAAEGMAKGMETMFAPAVAENLLTRNIQTYNGFVNIDLEPDMAYELETKLPNPFGGDAFPAKMTLSLSVSKDDPEDLFVVFDQAIDPAGMRKTVEALLEKLGGDKAAVEAVKKTLEKFSLVDEGLFVVHRPTGVIEMFETTRTTKADGLEKIERHRQRLLDGEHDHVWKDEEALEGADEDTVTAVE